MGARRDARRARARGVEWRCGPCLRALSSAPLENNRPSLLSLSLLRAARFADGLPALPYAYDALEPWIDAKTMEYHRDKHPAKYVDNLNKALAGKTPVSLARLQV